MANNQNKEMDRRAQLLADAQAVLDEYFKRNNHTEDEDFEAIEALQVFIDETKDPRYMMELGGMYYEWRNFDLALKYYNMAAEYDFEAAFECLGYIWYYGRTGERDFKKAFENFNKAAGMGNLVAEYKLADMYKNGYHVDKDYDKYCEIIENMFDKVEDASYLYEPLPEVFTRLARIRTEQGEPDEAVDLYLTAKEFLAQRIAINPFFGNRNIMNWLVNDLYALVEFDKYNFDLFDLYYVLKKPCKASFVYDGNTYEIEAVEEAGEVVVRFGDSWYRTIDSFIENAEIDGTLLTSIWNELHSWKIEE